MRIGLGVLMACLLGACVADQLVPCGDKLCPRGYTCVAGELCASATQITACDGKADGESCTLQAGATGLCDRGVCIAAGCGNYIVDANEVCDDGNQTSGDGCRADCRKLETCGDAILDDGEGCDDGNANPSDGCDACTPVAWRAEAVIGATNSTKLGLALTAGLVADRNGNVYVVDQGANRVFRLDATGKVTTVAGSSDTRGFGGDGGAATSALLNNPRGCAIDGLGNLYIADTFNNRIRRIDPDGIITTVAGNGGPGFSGDSGVATGAQLSAPEGIAVDGLGNLFIADTGNYRVRRVDLSGIITTYASSGATDLAVGGNGDLYLAESTMVRKVSPSGTFTTVAGTGVSGFGGDGGPATSARLSLANHIAFDAAGDLNISDAANRDVRRVDAGGVISTIASGLIDPEGIAFDPAGNLYVAERWPGRVRRMDTASTISTVAGGPASAFDGRSATSVPLVNPDGVAVDAMGNVYIADADDFRIRRVDGTGTISTVAGNGTPGSSGDNGPATAAQLALPWYVAVHGTDVYISDIGAGRVRRVDANGVITTVAGTGVRGYTGDGGPATSANVWPSGLALDNAGNLYIASEATNRVRRVDATTGVITTIAGTGVAGYSGDGGTAASAQLSAPTGVAVDTAGYVYIADRGNVRVRRVGPDGTITTFAGTGTSGVTGDGGPATSADLFEPNDVAADANGNVYIVDSSIGLLRRVDATGTIRTISGTGNEGTRGDGGPASNAEFSYPSAITVDGANQVYLADASNQRVRRIGADGTITTIAGLIDPEGMGAFVRADLADPRALVSAPPFTLIAGGSSGTVQAARTTMQRLDAVVGRYPQSVPTGTKARFRDATFGTIGGVAYDADAGVIYLTESSANRLHAVTIVDVNDAATWTITALNTDPTGGFADGALTGARFRDPTGLFLDAPAHQLYVADTGNHVIRAIDLSLGLAGATVRTIAGTPQTRGFYGDGGLAANALLYGPEAVTRCASGDLYVADTANHRVRRIATGTGTISTILGLGIPASSGDGSPASAFPVRAPRGLACDALGNLFVTSTTTVRLAPADASGHVDGSGSVLTIYGAPPRDTFPASVTRCLTGAEVLDAATVRITDSCTGLLIDLRRGPASPP